MNYEKKSFSVAVGSKEYAEKFEGIFGKKHICLMCTRIFRSRHDLGDTPVCDLCMDDLDVIPS